MVKINFCQRRLGVSLLALTLCTGAFAAAESGSTRTIRLRQDDAQVRFESKVYELKHLKATDSTAMTLAMDNNMTLVCFGLAEENSIIRVVRGEEIGTTVTN